MLHALISRFRQDAVLVMLSEVMAEAHIMPSQAQEPSPAAWTPRGLRFKKQHGSS